MQYTLFSRSVYALAACLVIFPVFVLTIKGWVSALLLITSLMSLYVLWMKRKELKEFPDLRVQASSDTVWLMVILAMPIMAIGMGQVFRHELILRDYDGPMRLALAIPILLAVKKIEFPVNILGFVIQYSIPATLFATFFFVWIFPDEKWGAGRLTTYFVDPLSFGSMCMTLALISLVSINLLGKDSWWLRAWKMLAVLAGIYLSIRSGSRTGWAGFPVVLLLLIWFKLRLNTDYYWMKIFLCLAVFVGIFVIAYNFIPVIHQRVDLALYDFMNYQWMGPNEDSAVGMRISFLRMAWFYFVNNPLGGWGDQGFKSLINSPEISVFASEATRNFAYNSGFHNEIATNMVRSGIWGLLASLAVFVVPVVFFINRLLKYLKAKSASSPPRRII